MRKYLIIQLTRDLSPKYANSKYSSILKTKTQSQQCVEDLNRYFCKEDIHMANKHRERCSTSLIIRQIQIKTTMRHHLTPVRMAINKKSTNNKCVRMVIVKKSTNNKCCRRCGQKGTLLHY